MTREERELTITYLEEMKESYIEGVGYERHPMPEYYALENAIKALETLEEFEKAQIITGGRLNGRAYAYKCGLEDGKRKALEQEPTTKNDLAVDCISRQFMRELGATCIATRDKNNKLIALGALDELPSVTPQEPQSFKWCRDCKEYDGEKHCCHRWSKVIRDTVTEIRQELEDIRAELHATAEMHSDGDYYLREEWIDEIIDKHISGK